MFGSRLKTWMENYIGRPKKKVQAEAIKGKPKANIAGHLILDSSESLAQSDTGISSGSQQVLSSSTTDYREGYSTATMDSDRSAVIHCHTAVSLPSPESAYSTGYSTDGTSPGATAPPEYYINIRTGKHYFPSPAPTPTSPHSHTAFPNLHSSPPQPLPRHPPPPDPSRLKSRLHSPPAPSHFQPLTSPPPLSFSKSPPKKTSPRANCSSLKLFLRSPKNAKTTPVKTKPLSPSKSKKWFKQPFHKFAHRRMDPSPIDKHFRRPDPFLPAQDIAASPRQRNRIKTNPWLPMAPASAHSFPLAPLPRNRSCNNTPLQHRKSHDLRPPPPPFHHPLEDPSRPPTPDRSDEDLTLNEMMGTYNESYVYEKETDILSDSDPTDCEDYETDSDAEKGGDERDSHDDELDFIDNVPFTDSDDSFPPNTPTCTYHPNKYPFLCSFRKEADLRRSARKGRRERRKGGGGKCSKCEDEESERKDHVEEDLGGPNLRKVLLKKAVAKNMSRSLEGGVRRGRCDAGSPRVLLLMDEEADERYKELMEEAENMLKSLRNSPVAKSKDDERGNKSMEADRGRRQRMPGKGLILSLPVEPARKVDSKTSFRAKSSAHSPLDPLGPTLKNLTVFTPAVELVPSSSEDFLPVPIAFQSVVLGKPPTSYCPQSEPVKRKIYSCSKTYDRLVKHLEQEIQPVQESRPHPPLPAHLRPNPFT